MDKELESKIEFEARRAAFISMALINVVQEAALNAIHAKVSREQFMRMAGVLFDDNLKTYEEAKAANIAECKARMCEGDSSKESP